MRAGSASGAGDTRWAELLLALALATFSVSSVVEIVKNVVGIDYYLYWATDQALDKRELQDVYDQGENERVGRRYLELARQEARALGHGSGSTRRLEAAKVRSSLDNFSTPFLYAVFGSISAPRYEVALDRMQYASIALYLLGIVVASRALGYSWLGVSLLVWLATMASGPFIDDVSVANVNRIQVGLLCLAGAAFASPRGRAGAFVGGLVLGLGVMFKPNLAYCAVALVCLWLATRNWRVLARASLGGASAALLALACSWLEFGSLEPWLAWWPRLSALMGSWATEAGNQSLARVMSDRLGWSGVAWFGALFLGLVVAATFTTRLRAGYRAAHGAELLALGLGALASLLATRLVWYHYYLLVVPLVLWLLRPTRNARIEVVLVLVAALLVLTDLFRKVLPASVFDVSIGIALGALALFALGLLDLIRGAAQGVGLERESHAAG